MTKRLSSKLLSVILTIAICASAVFGCLITANAAEATCYAWSDGSVDVEANQATVKLTIEKPSELSGGIYEMFFDIDCEGVKIANLGDDVESVKILSIDGAALDAEKHSLDYAKGGTYIDVAAADVDYNFNKVVLEITLTFEPAVLQGQQYKLNLKNLQMTNGDEGENDSVWYTRTAEDYTLKASCDHVYDITKGEYVTTDTVEGYHVYKDVPCTKCPEVNPYQIVPATELKEVLYWDGNLSEPKTTDADGNILITSAAELAYITSNNVTGNYKIADGIDAIVLQSKAHSAILDLENSTQTKAYFEDTSKTFTAWQNSGVFQGTLDGNGVEIYGIYCTGDKGGLFGTVYENTSIENLSVKNSYLKAKVVAGAFTAALYASDAYLTTTGSNGYSISGLTALASSERPSGYYTLLADLSTGVLTFDKCVVSGCYISSDKAGNTGYFYGSGILLGKGAQFVNMSASNLLVYGNLALANGVEQGITGFLSTGHSLPTTNNKLNNTEIKNCIILDCVPYTVYDPDSNNKNNQAYMPGDFSNVYTNCEMEFNPCTNNGGGISAYDGKIILIDKAAAKGDSDIIDKLNTANGSEIWHANPNGGYPVFESATEAVVDYTEYNHATKTGSVIYHDGNNKNFDTDFEGSGTPEDPYLITNFAEFRAVAQHMTAIENKHYKLADGIKVICMLSKANIKANYNKNYNKVENLPTYTEQNAIKYLLSLSASETKAFMEGAKNNSIYNAWVSANNASTTCTCGCDSTIYAFNGTIDFNGATVCALYGNAGAIFPSTIGDATIKNLNAKNLYLNRTGYIGAIVAQSNIVNKTEKDKEGSLTIENCSVTDCYFESTSSKYGPAIFVGNTANGYQDVNDVDGDESTTDWINGPIRITNCFADIDPDCFVAAGGSLGGVGLCSGTNNVSVSDCLILGVKPYVTWTAYEGAFQHYFNTSSFSNVYTDQSLDYAYNSKNEKVTYTDKQIQRISASSLQGAGAKDTLQGFDFENVWTYDANGGYPTPVPQPSIYTTSQFNLNLLGTNISYNNDGTFDFNFYYEPKAGIDPVLYVGQADGTGFTKLENGVVCDDAFCDKMGLPKGTVKYTITNISARHLDSDFLPTAVATVGGHTVWGKSEQISVEIYANDIINDPANSDEDKAVALALVNYGEAAATALNTPSASDKVATDTIYWSGDAGSETKDTLADPNDGSGDGKSWETAIIIDNAEELYVLTHSMDVLSTTGNYYKIADNIKNIILQAKDKVDTNKLMGYETPAEVMTYLTTEISDRKDWTGKNAKNVFNGNFDGNGATVYGMYANGSWAGLFPYVDGGTPDATYSVDSIGNTFKNINIRNSYLYTTWRGGAIVAGSASVSDTTYSGNKVKGALNFENCSVANCYMTTNKVDISKGVLFGQNTDEVYHVNNCLVYGNYAQGPNSSGVITEYTLMGVGSDRFTVPDDTSSPRDYCTVKNSLILGVTPYTNQWSNNCNNKACFQNVYTDKDVHPYDTVTNDANYYKNVMFQITDLTSIQGAAAMSTLALDFDNEWIVNSGAYPTPVQRDVEIEGKTIYWDGDVATGIAEGKGTREEPYIINTAAELAYIAASNYTTYANTANKYYEIADNIDKIVLQSKDYANDIINLKDSAAVKDYFEDTTKIPSPHNWVSKSYKNNIFAGHFNGNGATIYGLYSSDAKGARVAGLFPLVEGNSTFEGITLKNSYMNHGANSSNWNFGGIVGMTSNSSDDVNADDKGVVWIEQCSVVNNYMRAKPNNINRAGLIAGNIQVDAVIIEDCLVYGNDAVATFTSDSEDYEMHLVGYMRNDIVASDEFYSNHPNWVNSSTEKHIYGMVVNTIVLDTPVYNTGAASFSDNWKFQYYKCYENVYTDMTLVDSQYSKATEYATTINVISKADLIGSNAAKVLASSMLAENGGVWYVGNQYDGLPGFQPAGTMPSANQLAYDNITFDLYNDYGTGTDQFGLYVTSLNLKNNPYMSLVFAFGKEDETNYRELRDQITITYKVGDGEVKTLPALPAYDADKDGKQDYFSNVNGWSNTKNAGRYHTYTLKDLAVYDLNEPITVTVTCGDRTQTATVSLSGFANECQSSYLKTGSEQYKGYVEAVKALLYYSQTLEALRAAQ